MALRLHGPDTRSSRMQPVCNAIIQSANLGGCRAFELHCRAKWSRLALDTWTEQLPAALVLTGHSLKNALPHILMLQMAREWANILIYRPYYRSIIGASRSGEKRRA